MRNSRDRCSARASDSLSPAALAVVSPQAVLVLIPVLTVSLSEVLRESLVWLFREPPAASGSTPCSVRLRPVPRVLASLADQDAASELTEPAVLV
jgi:hypothetical protein